MRKLGELDKFLDLLKETFAKYLLRLLGSEFPRAENCFGLEVGLRNALDFLAARGGRRRAYGAPGIERRRGAEGFFGTDNLSVNV